MPGPKVRAKKNPISPYHGVGGDDIDPLPMPEIDFKKDHCPDCGLWFDPIREKGSTCWDKFVLDFLS